MALAASPQPPQALTEEQEARSLQLDDDIAKVRAESENSLPLMIITLTRSVSALTQRRNCLTSALFRSSQVQSRLRQNCTLSTDSELTVVLDQQTQQNQQSTYRLAFGVTGFPFVDPSPDTSNVPLLGIRFDICKRDGHFDAPYYILFKRIGDESSEVRVHRHTIPALVLLRQYEEKYLPLQDEGYGSVDSVLGGGGGRQDLEAFVGAVRKDLVAWQLRQESIEMVREKLGLTAKVDVESEPVRERGNEDEFPINRGKYGIVTVEPVAVDAHFARIIWADGRVGRIKIGEDGNIQKAVVIGVVDEQEQRSANDERNLVAEDARIDSLVETLKIMHERK